MRGLVLLLMLVLPHMVWAQSSEVLPDELSIKVTIEETGHTPLAREMILVTIRGVYRRHITRELLVQPDLEGFSWSQLGTDYWRDERIDGRAVKTLVRRMALYPDAPGELTIGAFTHRLTLTDEGDDWFEHEITSEPVTIKVDPAPKTDGWWFPVKRLRISDQWSNAPDQLVPGEGVLRVVQVEALGATPEMIPPMPELVSPSGMIFPHPEKRIVELTPYGPMTIAFWRWTIRPGNDVSTIVEPLTVPYFNTTTREMREAVISAQRVAFGAAAMREAVVGEGDQAGATGQAWQAGILPGAALLSFVICVVLGLRGRVWAGLSRLPGWDPRKRALRRAIRSGTAAQARRALVDLAEREGQANPYRSKLAALDAAIFAGGGNPESPDDSFGESWRDALRKPRDARPT